MSEGFADIIKRDLLGKYVEIYQGDEHHQHDYADFNNEIKTVIYGKLLEVEGACLIIEVKRNNHKGKVYVSSWSISSITETKQLTMQEAYSPATDILNKKARAEL